MFNAGYGDQITILELAHRVLSLTDSRFAIQFERARLGDLHHSRASIERSQNAGSVRRDAGCRPSRNAFGSPL
jgi:UDP-glucose 4-epimerase